MSGHEHCDETCQARRIEQLVGGGHVLLRPVKAGDCDPLERVLWRHPVERWFFADAAGAFKDDETVYVEAES